MGYVYELMQDIDKAIDHYELVGGVDWVETGCACMFACDEGVELSNFENDCFLFGLLPYFV